MKSKQDKFLELFKPLRENIWRFCLSISRSRDNAKDLLQETIEIAYRQFDDLKNETAFLSYLFTIASRINRANTEKQSKMVFLEETEWEFITADSVSPETRLDINLLYQALDQLPYEQKEAIILQDIMGFSQKEICEVQNIKIDALKQRLYRGKQKLKELLTGEEVTEKNYINNLPERRQK